MNIKIIGTGSYLPEKIVTNDDLSKLVKTSDEWIFTRTGIKERRIAAGKTNTDLAVMAVKNAIADAKINKDEIDLIICATVTADTSVPSISANIRKELEIENAVAFDINAACTGFIYAITIAKNMMEAMSFKKAVVVGVEVLSQITNWNDRTTCVLFGDGAGAAILEKSNESGSGINYTVIRGAIDKTNALTCGIKHNIIPFENPNNDNKIDDNNNKLIMNGKEVFVFAVNEMMSLINETLEKTGFSKDDIDYFVPHQANVRIINSTASRLLINKEKFIVNLQQTGNTSSASIPLALDYLFKSRNIKKGSKIVLVGFGGGFTSGAILFTV